MTTPYEPCVTDANGKCTRWSHDHPAEDAHPAPTPAPVAVPEGDLVDVARLRRWFEEKAGQPFIAIEPHVLRHLIESIDTLQTTTRPEPVVAPLPSEAEALARVASGYDDLTWANLRKAPEAVDLWLGVAGRILAAGYRLVPEDDEDTVRVPRVALIELNAAVMDRKRDLVDAIEEFNDEVRS